MQFWCLAPLPTGEEPRQKLMSEDYQPPAVVLLKTYQLDSSVGADEDSDPEVSDDMVDQPEASSATRPGRKMRAAIAKLSSSRATVMAATTKIAKLEADKNMRKRKVIPIRRPKRSRKKMKPLMIRWLLITARHRGRQVPRPRGTGIWSGM
jgi:hypothetical protein